MNSGAGQNVVKFFSKTCKIVFFSQPTSKGFQLPINCTHMRGIKMSFKTQLMGKYIFLSGVPVQHLPICSLATLGKNHQLGFQSAKMFSFSLI